MNNRSGGPRSFNTIKRSNRADRLRRRRQARMILLAMCAVILLLALTGLIFLICHIAAGLQAPPDNDPSQSGTPGNSSGIVYQMQSKRYEEIRQGELIVVNNGHIYSFPATRLETLNTEAKQPYLIEQYRQKVNGTNPYMLNLSKEMLLQPAAAQAVNQWLTQYYVLSGRNDIAVRDAYRSEQDQQNSGSSTVMPGYSEHHTGLNVWLRTLKQTGGTYGDINVAEHEWLFTHCAEYGLIQRYPTNKSGITGIPDYAECFRYVGLPHATYITANGLCLEEYVELLKNNHTSQTGSDGKHLAIDTTGDGKADYEVYYVPANTGMGALTTVPVPSNLQYTVSGDNIGGFIVTVDLNSQKTA